MNQVLSFLECHSNLNREQFQKKRLNLLAVLNIVLYNWSSSLSFSKELEEEDTLGQNPFDIDIIITLEQ